MAIVHEMLLFDKTCPQPRRNRNVKYVKLKNDMVHSSKNSEYMLGVWMINFIPIYDF